VSARSRSGRLCGAARAPSHAASLKGVHTETYAAVQTATGERVCTKCVRTGCTFADDNAATCNQCREKRTEYIMERKRKLVCLSRPACLQAPGESLSALTRVSVPKLFCAAPPGAPPALSLSQGLSTECHAAVQAATGERVCSMCIRTGCTFADDNAANCNRCRERLAASKSKRSSDMVCLWSPACLQTARSMRPDLLPLMTWSQALNVVCQSFGRA
jgi:hypothetical protein